MKYYIYELYRQVVKFGEVEHEYSFWRLYHKQDKVLVADSAEAVEKQHADATIWSNNPRIRQTQGFNDRVIPPYILPYGIDLFESEY